MRVEGVLRDERVEGRQNVCVLGGGEGDSLK